ncbi:MAG: C40 family peptidase [Armatimonadetes bacterium]|nr:C40 family peptidase [Armatimonadota bacterium]
MAARVWELGVVAALLASAPSAVLAKGEIIIEVQAPSLQQAVTSYAPPATMSPAVPTQPPVTTYGRLGVAIAGAPIHRVPDPRSQPFAALSRGTYVVVGPELQGYYAILMSDGGVGYVPTSHVRLLDYQVTAVQPGELPRTLPSVSQLSGSQSASETFSPEAEAVVGEALRYLDVRYRWGGNGFSGVDCSGLVKNCFETIGVRLPRTAREQAQVGALVALDQLQPGDRLYFKNKFAYDHTGIYLGNGQFIHASGRHGEVLIEPLDRYRGTLAAARR